MGPEEMLKRLKEWPRGLNLDQRKTVREALNALQQEHATFGLRYELTGPWPAYNFVPVGGTQQ